MIIVGFVIHCTICGHQDKSVIFTLLSRPQNLSSLLAIFTTPELLHVTVTNADCFQYEYYRRYVVLLVLLTNNINGEIADVRRALPLLSNRYNVDFH